MAMFTLRQIFKTYVFGNVIKLSGGKEYKFHKWRQNGQKRFIRLSHQNETKTKVIMNSSMHEKSDTFKFTDYDCIGFDLDNTLARYKVGAMIEMEYDIIAKFMVEQKGYSKDFLLQPFDKNFILKGLIVDDENGNILRIAPNGIILQATHGTKFLSDKEILQYYPKRRWQPTDIFSEDPLETWNGPHAEKMRTLLDYFDIVGSLIFARAVDSIDQSEGKRQKSYSIWPDLLESLQDMFKRENFQTSKGIYFEKMKENPDKYYYKCSGQLLKWLNDLKNRNKSLFLITGAHVDFASHTASNTLGSNWRDYFDMVICYAKKPGFFTLKREFIGLNGFQETGSVGLDELLPGNIYTHGNWRDLQKFLKNQCQVPDPKFLYIGDNLVQDIYTPSIHTDCDTVTVCEELQAEGLHGHDQWHPDEQFLVSTIWGSYFHCKNTNEITIWYHIMRKHSRLCVPSIEYVASFPVDHAFKANPPLE